MSSTTITVQTTGRACTTIATGPLSLASKFTGATSLGDVWASSGKEMIAIKNASGAQITVTLQLALGVNASVDKQLPVNPFLAVAAGDTAIVGPFPAYYKDASGNITVTYSSVTSISIVAFVPAPN